MEINHDFEHFDIYFRNYSSINNVLFCNIQCKTRNKLSIFFKEWENENTKGILSKII